tara:strand:- start:377 stop:1489 length:1113 start_codon:yes stop_codon:yes gene_type:complete
MVKLTKSQLKELIRHSIRSVVSEEDVMDKTIKYKDDEGNEKEATVGGILKKGEDHPAHKQAQAMIDKGGEKEPTKKTKISADPFAKDDVGGPAHPNVPKGTKSSKDLEKKTMKAATDANKKMEIDVLNKQADKGDGAQIDTEYGTVTWTSGDPDEDTFFATNEDGEEIEVDYNDIIRFHNDNDSIMKNLRKESIKESKKRRYTVKEVRMWMKKLEENRYKKVYNSDCRRVAWMVNNMKEDVTNMPKSMSKKWTKAQYGRERYLAKEFLKSQLASLKEQLKRQKKGKLTEAPKPIHHMDARFLYVPKKDIKNTIKLLRLNIKHGNVEVEKKPSPKVKGHYRLTTSKKMFDDVVTHLAMKNIGVKTISKGKM